MNENNPMAAQEAVWQRSNRGNASLQQLLQAIRDAGDFAGNISPTAASVAARDDQIGNGQYSEQSS